MITAVVGGDDMSRFISGWIKLHRQILSGDLAETDNFTLGVWVRLLLMANWLPGSALLAGEQAKLTPGQLVTGLKELAGKRGDRHFHRTRHALQYLEKSGRIAQTTSKHGRLISVCNWAEFQAAEDTDSSQSADEAQSRRNQGADEAQPIEEGNKARSKNRRPKQEYTQEFERIYGLYPRKEGKSDGYKMFEKTIRSTEDEAKLVRAIGNYSARCRREERDAQFIKQFGTFMGCWQDYLVDETPARPALHEVKAV